MVQPEERAPSTKPPFTLSEIKQSIPEHCFKRSFLRSSSYLLYDLIIISLLVYTSTFIDILPVAQWIKWFVLWPLYWYTCGAFATGVWVIAHECGHGAYAESPFLNDIIGFIFHSALLVPYFSWKISHRRHHSNTGSISRDEVFVPHIKEEISEEFSIMSLAPMRLIRIVLTLTIGWILYLTTNIAGRPYPGWANHFNPYSPIFSAKERFQIVLSDLGLIFVSYVLYLISSYFGFIFLVKTYLIPYFIVNFWLVLITLLQHTHPKLPHYDDSEWEWLKGAFSTIDRDYGYLNVVFHHITDTHVAHHLFSKIPHYHAAEVTKIVKEIVGDYYQRDERNIFVALWQDWALCRYVAPDKKDDGVFWYRP